MTMTPTEKAREVFGGYAGMDAPDLPVHPQSKLQVLLCRWQTKNFGTSNLLQQLAGVTEEVGELAHAVLKHDQKIRGFEDEEKFREAAGDAVADAVVYLNQLCTLLRLDFGTLVNETALEVMQRDWKESPENAHEYQSAQLDLPLVCNKFVEPRPGTGSHCRNCSKPASAHPSFEMVDPA